MFSWHFLFSSLHLSSRCSSLSCVLSQDVQSAGACAEDPLPAPENRVLFPKYKPLLKPINPEHGHLFEPIKML